MGNPLACAVALANLDLLGTGEWETQVRRISSGLASGLAATRRLGHVADVRTLGAVGVVELTHPVDVAKATEAALAEGVWLRPFRNLLYTMPPYVATDDDVARICAAVDAAAVAG
jgi:adenosylmethionine-8-amino-7-oxononanoate aminotransferase